ncbi:MAG TPA: DUF29 domain-containing protein [Candidatus Competibacter sp.]|nr:DUF29 domain-containing protein [Candidatus Competibacteraceae bacterium]HPE70713.1 DUF29 domain-containing protein [Candidatus Competibacter sp.]HRW64130.1 DUF29 domain-containing protein [Candidatus Competibacter sp.]
METLYERDLFAWAMRNAAFLREGRLGEIDRMNIAEELESMGRSERRALGSRLAILMMHLLKWRYQPERRGRSWRATIREQQRQVAWLLDDNPSLRPELQGLIANTYIDAVLMAVAETNLDEGIFPVSCPFVWEQLMSEDEKQWD